MISKLKPYLYPALLSIMSFMISLCSPLHPFAKSAPLTDSSVFLLIGKSMSQGIMPYRDLFDHKGPLLYVFNWLGMLIGSTGVWLIELICISLAAWFCFKTARRFFDEATSFLGTAATFIALLSWFEGGNLTESYALPFSFGALYCLTGYFVQNFELNRKQVFMSGLCMGGVLLLRPNLIGLWVGMCAVIFVHSLIIRKIKFIFQYILFFISGIIVFLLPFIIWLGMKGLLSDCYYCYLQFNSEYVDVPLKEIYNSMYTALNYPVIPIAASALFVLLFVKDNRKSYKFILTISMIAIFGTTALLTSLSGYTFPHYYMAYLPCLILPISFIIQAVITHTKIKPILILITISLVLHQSIDIGREMFRNTLKTSNQDNALASFIKENTTHDDPILYIGNYCNIYLLSERSPASYYPYYSMRLITVIIDSYLDELELKKPRLIAYGNRELPETLSNYIYDNYTVVFEYGNSKISILNE